MEINRAKAPKENDHHRTVKHLTVREELDLLFGAAKNKLDIIKALEICTALHCIPLAPPNVSVEQTEKDFRREKVLLNDVAFVPDQDDEDREHAFSATLSILIQRLMKNPAVYDNQKYMDHNTIKEILMQRACRTSAGLDCFFTIQQLLCTEGTFLAQKMLPDDPPILIDVFVTEHIDAPTTTAATVHEKSMTATSHPPTSTSPSSTTTTTTTTMPPLPPTQPVSIASSSNKQNTFKLNKSLLGANANTTVPSSSSSNNLLSSQPQYDLCARIQVLNRLAVYNVNTEDDDEEYNLYVMRHTGNMSQQESSDTSSAESSGEDPGKKKKSRFPKMRLNFRSKNHHTHTHAPHQKAKQRDSTSSSSAAPSLSGGNTTKHSSNGSGQTSRNHQSPAGLFHREDLSDDGDDEGGGGIEEDASDQLRDSMNHRDSNNLVDMDAEPKPWLDIEAIVMDESNFHTGEHWRKLNIMVTCVDTGVTYSSSIEGNSISDHLRVSGRLSQRKVLNELASWFATDRHLHTVGSNNNLNRNSLTHDESNTNSHLSGMSGNILGFLSGNSSSHNDSGSDSSSTSRSRRSRGSTKSNRSNKSTKSSQSRRYLQL